MMYSDEQIEAYRDHLTRCLPSGIFVHPTWSILHSQQATRQRTEAADATASSATVDTEAEAQQGQTNNQHTTDKRQTTTTTTKETKDNSNIH